MCFFFFFQAEDGIRDTSVTGVQTCALPICIGKAFGCFDFYLQNSRKPFRCHRMKVSGWTIVRARRHANRRESKIGRASCREREYTSPCKETGKQERKSVV